MKIETGRINIGKLVKPHGVAGEILLRIFPQWQNYAPEPSYLFVELQGEQVPFELFSFRPKNNAEWIIEIDTVTSADEVQKLQDALVYIESNEMGESSDEDDSVQSLADYLIADKNFGPLGKVKRVIEIHNNPLLELEYHEKEILIPLQEDFILSIDHDQKSILIDAPSGLIDLYVK